MQTEIDACLLHRQLEMHETEDDIVHDHVINDRDEACGNEDNEDWMEDTITNYVDEQDFYDVSEVQTRWDKNHDCTQLHQECTDPLNMQDIQTNFKHVLKSRRVINRRWVDKKTLN